MPEVPTQNPGTSVMTMALKDSTKSHNVALVLLGTLLIAWGARYVAQPGDDDAAKKDEALQQRIREQSERAALQLTGKMLHDALKDGRLPRSFNFTFETSAQKAARAALGDSDVGLEVPAPFEGSQLCILDYKLWTGRCPQCPQHQQHQQHCRQPLRLQCCQG